MSGRPEPARLMVKRVIPGGVNRYTEEYEPEREIEEWHGWWGFTHDRISVAATTPAGAVAMYERIQDARR